MSCNITLISFYNVEVIQYDVVYIISYDMKRHKTKCFNLLLYMTDDESVTSQEDLLRSCKNSKHATSEGMSTYVIYCCQIYIYTYTHTCLYIHIHTHTHTRTHTYIHTHSQTHIHTFIHIYTHELTPTHTTHTL